MDKLSFKQRMFSDEQGFLIGAITGTVIYVFSNVFFAMATAFLCGFAGIAGKELYEYGKEKFFKRNKKKNKAGKS